MGSVNIDNTGSGADVTLSSDGTDLLLDGTAVGGGGAASELYAENPSTPTTPTATGSNAVAIGSNAVSSGTNSLAFGTASALGDRSLAIHTGTNASNGATTSDAIAIGEFARATNSMAVAIGRSSGATGSQALALGFVATAVGNNSTAIQRGLANGVESFAAHITNSTTSYGASGANSVAIGYQAKATAADAVAIGDRNVASGNGSVALASRSTASGSSAISIGLLADATGASSMALGSGYSFNGAQATFFNSIAIGQGSLSDKIGKVAVSGAAFSSSGDGQHGIFVLRVATTDATATPLITGPDYVGSYTPDDENQIILPNNSAYAFHGTIVARQQASAGTASAAWKVEGLIRREGSAGTTVLVNSATTVLDNTPSWGMTLSADTTNGGLKVEATGAASTNIRWVATIHTSEVTYA